jgi:protein-disulfide isomerase
MLVVTAAGGALLWTLYTGPEAETPTAPRPQVESVRDLEIAASVATKRMGRASIVLVEFSDYECPFCGVYARDTYPKIRSELVDKGKLTYVSMAFPLERIHPNARPASEAAECASQQGRFWPMHERLFGAPRGELNVTHFAKSAQAIGLDLERFKSCLSGETPSSVAAEIAEARRLSVNSTPTFFVGTVRTDGSIELKRRIKGAASFETIIEAIDEVSKII